MESSTIRWALIRQKQDMPQDKTEQQKQDRISRSSSWYTVHTKNNESVDQSYKSNCSHSRASKGLDWHMTRGMISWSPWGVTLVKPQRVRVLVMGPGPWNWTPDPLREMSAHNQSTLPVRAARPFIFTQRGRITCHLKCLVSVYLHGLYPRVTACTDLLYLINSPVFP